MKKANMVGVIVVILLLAGGIFYVNNSKLATQTIMVNHTQLTVDLPVSIAQVEKGLSGRKSLQENQGMLFIFPKEDSQSFWMPDMNFPIDIIWINKNCEIVHIEKNLQPCVDKKTCPLITPDKMAQFVLETVAGFSEKYQVKVGEKLNFCESLPKPEARFFIRNAIIRAYHYT